jgi:hypothetical protein
MTKEQLLAIENNAKSQINLADDRTDIDGIRGKKTTSEKYTQYEPQEKILFSPATPLFNLFSINAYKPLYNSYQALEYIIDTGTVGASELQEGECPADCGGTSSVTQLMPMGSIGRTQPATYEFMRNKLNSNSRNPEEESRAFIRKMIEDGVTSVIRGVNNKLWNGVKPTGANRYGIVGLLAQHKSINDATTASNFNYDTVNYANTATGISDFVESVYVKHNDAVTRHAVTKAVLMVPKGGSTVPGINEQFEETFGNQVNITINAETVATREALLEAIKSGNIYSIFPTRARGFNTSDFVIVECDEMAVTEAYYYPIEVNAEVTTQHHSFYLGDFNTQSPIKLSSFVSNTAYLTEFPELGALLTGFDRVTTGKCRGIEVTSTLQGIYQFKAVGLGKYWNDVNIFPTTGGLELPKYIDGNMTNVTGVI